MLLFQITLLFISNICVIRGDFNLVILHTNDVHARIEQTNKYSSSCSVDDVAEDKCYGGVARRYSAISEIRNNYSNVLLMDAGDEFQGTLWFSYYNGSEASYFMNRLGYDVMTLGNHEFDNGVAGLVHPFLENVTFPVLACNINTSQVPDLQALIQPYTILNVSGTLVGVVGYITTATSYLVDPEKIKNIDFTNEVTCVTETVHQLLQRGVTRVVALGHSGFTTSKLIATIPGVDVVVDGHSNTFLYNGEPPDIETPAGPYPVVVDQEGGGRALVYTAYAYGKYLGLADIVFNEDGEVMSWTGNPLLLDKTWPQDAAMLEEVERWKQPLDTLTQDIVGQSYVKLEGGEDPCRFQECNLGNLVTDAVLYTHLRPPVGENWTDVAIAIWNGGGIRVTLEQGDITLGQIMEVMPFRNSIDKVKVTGHVLKQMLEHSVTAINPEEPPGRFLQMSGIKVAYNIKEPEGSRVAEVLVRCTNCQLPEYEPLDDMAVYAILTSNYLVNGGDGYNVLKDNFIDRENIGTLDFKALSDYIRIRSPIIHGLEGRITYVEGKEDKNSCVSEANFIQISLQLFSFTFIFTNFMF